MWLLKSSVAQRLEQFSKAGFAPTADLHAEFVKARASRGGSGASDEGIYVTAGDTAQITIEGVLTEQPDFWAWLLGIGNTAYADIRAAFTQAANDPAIKKVSLRVASPGGHVDGLFDTLATIQAFSKPVSVLASCACSAAYALAAAAGKIQATGPAAEFGSIGVAASFSFDASEHVVDLTSTAAPNKRPDPRTPEGAAVIVEYLDALHELFADAIAQGRGTTAAKVNSGYGQGASMLAKSAMARGMVDSVAPAGGKAGDKAASAEHGPLTAAALAALDRPEPAPGESLTAFAARRMHEADAAADTRDLGDLVADRLCGQIDAELASQGKPRGKSRATYSEAIVIEMPQSARKVQAVSPDFDLGDAIVAILDARKLGKPPPVFVESAPAPAASTGPDIGDQIVAVLEERGLIKREHQTAR